MKKEVIFNSLFAIFIVVIYSIFPTKNNFQNIAVTISFFLLVPFFFNLIVTKKPLREIGICLGEWRKGFLYGFISLLIALLFFYVVFYYTEFSLQYILEGEIQANFFKFLFYEFSLVLPFVVFYEFFFRGFLMLSLKKQIGYFAILAQTIVFFLLLVLTNSLDWYFVPYLIFSLFSGIIVFKSKSLVYSTIAHIIFLIIVDASVIAIK